MSSFPKFQNFLLCFSVPDFAIYRPCNLHKYLAHGRGIEQKLTRADISAACGWHLFVLQKLKDFGHDMVAWQSIFVATKWRKIFHWESRNVSGKFNGYICDYFALIFFQKQNQQQEKVIVYNTASLCGPAVRHFGLDLVPVRLLWLSVCLK